jgi:hypothetical protein
MASNGTTLPVRNGTNNAEKALNRADEVDDVSGCFSYCVNVPNGSARKT